MRYVTLLSLALLSAAATAAQQPASDVPDSLMPPAGTRKVLEAHATGAQIYTCAAVADGKFSWTLKGPDADLRDADGKTIVKHSAGPTWQHMDGSRVTGKVAAKESAHQADSVPWLLLTADNSHSSAGALSKVTYIQRIHTDGGQPPVTGCDEAHKGDETRSNYSADYVFYAASQVQK
jgi:hypothetical protein